MLKTIDCIFVFPNANNKVFFTDDTEAQISRIKTNRLVECYGCDGGYYLQFDDGTILDKKQCKIIAT
jgi:hypothetical protein